ncbi:MAG: carboxymuconolactone decarboxylase family protein [Mycobacterium sp.]
MNDHNETDLGGISHGSPIHQRLPAHDLSLLNIAVAAAQNRPELRNEIEHALRNGVTDAEILDILDEVARYTGHERTHGAQPRVPPEDG